MIDFLKEWYPPCGNDARIRDYIRREQLYRSQHMLAFERKSAKMPVHLRDKTYLIQDYPRLITSTYAAVIYGKPPVFSCPGNQAGLDDLVRANEFKTALYEGELSCSFRGDLVFRVSVGSSWDGGKPRVMIEEIPADWYFVEHDQDSTRRVLSQCLAWERVVGDGDNAKVYLVVQHHEVGQVITQLFLRDGYTKVIKQVRLSELYGDRAPAEVQPTRIDVPTLIHVPNLRDGSLFYGDSDYTPGLETLFDEANMRITQIGAVLDKHAGPKMVMPPGTLDKKGQIKASDLEVMEVYPDEANSNVPRALVWDAQLGPAFEQLQVVEGQILTFSHVSPRMLGKQSTNTDSGDVMDKHFVAMILHASRKQTYRQPRIEDVLLIAQKMQNAWLDGAEPKPVEVVWKNGLPTDDKELTDVCVLQVMNRLMSRETAIRYFRQVGPDEAKRELQMIADEDTKYPPAQPPPTPKMPNPQSSGAPTGLEVIQGVASAAP